jgi:hypothetical protein
LPAEQAQLPPQPPQVCLHSSKIDRESVPNY